MDFYVTWQVAALTGVAAGVGLATVVALARIHGLRSFAKMAPHDFATTVAIGSVLAATAASSVPVFKGVAALVALFGIQKLFQLWRQHGGDTIIDNDPVVLMRGTTVQWDTMRRTGVTVEDLRAKLREANVLDYRQVRAVVLETTGDISVLHGEEGGVRLDPDLMRGVRGVDPDDDPPTSWLAPEDRGHSPLTRGSASS